MKEQITRSKDPWQYWWCSSLYIYLHLQNAKIPPIVVGKNSEKNQKIFAEGCEVAVLTTAYNYII